MRAEETSGRRAVFVDREECINCCSEDLEALAGGSFSDDPLRSFIEGDPWGVSPLPFVEHEEWSFVRCRNCSQLFHRRILSPEWMQTCYSDWVSKESIEEFESARYTPQVRFDRGCKYVSHILRIEKHTRDLRQGDLIRVLDFGCGWGDFLVTCERFGIVGRGIDFAPGRRSVGQIDIFPSIKDLEQSDESGVPFHAVTLFQVLEHVEAPRDLLKSLRELLMPGGILVLETPNCAGVTGIQSLSDFRAIHPLSHVNGFTPETLRSIAERLGFRKIKRGTAQVTADFRSTLKGEIKHLAGGDLRPKTALCFRRT